MNLYAASILLRNLISRIEIQDDGSGTLTGRLTADELAMLQVASDLLDESLDPEGDSTVDVAAGAQPSPIVVRTGEPNRTDPHVPSKVRSTVPQVKLNLSALGPRVARDDARICLDFGTAMSKATLVVDGGTSETEDIHVLPLGGPGDQEEVSETMLISSVYIDNGGILRFGKAAVDYSMPEGSDGSRGRLDNIKRRLSEEGWDEQVNRRFNPTNIPVSYGDMVLAYLAFLTWTINTCLVDTGYPKNMPRRFAVPCFSGEKRHEVHHKLKKLVGEAQILSDTFGPKLRDGIPLSMFVQAIEELRRSSREYPFVLDDVVEPLGVANSIMSWTRPIDSLVLVIDIGAGTSDLSLYRLKINPERDESVGIEVEGSARVLTEAGNHLDRLLIALIVKKSGITSDDSRWINVQSALELRIREFKESLFQDDSVLVVLEWIEVEIELEEFLGLEAVRQFGRNLRSTMIEILESVDQSWVGWIKANPGRYLTVALTGGGAELPMVKELAGGSITIRGSAIETKRAIRFPDWLREVDENLEGDYPRVAVAIGGGRRRLIDRGEAARITGGDVVDPPTLGGYFQKGT